MPKQIIVPANAKDDVHYWLALMRIPRLSIRDRLNLVDEFGLHQLFSYDINIHNIFLTASQKAALFDPDWSAINKIISRVNEIGAQIVCYNDERYPERLKEIEDPPLIIYCKGNTELLNSDQLAIVGSRSSTVSGKEVARSFASQLANQGVTVTSGLALGIDAASHQAALNTVGNTIGVIAQGIDLVYPKRHKKLYQDIVDSGGLIVTEFSPGVSPRAGHFPKRNRIISGLSLGVLVVEAEIKSGTLVTARLALEQNRDVFAVPGSINNPMSAGCHWLIKQGAKLVENVADILIELNNYSDNIGLNYKRENKKALDTKKSGDSHLLIDPLLASVDYETTPVDKVVSRSKLPIEEVLTRLTVLELRGLVTAVPGGYLKLNGG